MDCGSIIFGTESYVALLLRVERFLHLVGPHLKRELQKKIHMTNDQIIQSKEKTKQ